MISEKASTRRVGPLDEPVIRLEDVHLLYGRVLVLDIPQLEVRPGERVFVLGSSGSGKTSLARLIKGRVQPSTGTVQVLGEKLAAPAGLQRRRMQRRIAMIDQEFFLVPRMSVVANVLTGALGRLPLARGFLGWYPAQTWRQAEEILREVGLEALAERRVETLSGGQRQRAAIARALMQDADLVIADEPTSSLDPQLAQDVLELLVQCTARRGLTLMVNLHQPELARRFASRFLGLAGGRLVYDGPPEGFGDREAQRIYRDGAAEDRRGSEDGGDGRRHDMMRGEQHGDDARAAMEAPLPRPDLRLVGD